MPRAIKAIIALWLIGTVLKYGQEWVSKNLTDKTDKLLKGKKENPMPMDQALEKALEKFLPRLPTKEVGKA